MSREVTEIVVELATSACSARGPVPVDAMKLFAALQKLPPEELAALVAAVTLEKYLVVPATPPSDWNKVKKRGYGILVRQAVARLV